MRKLLALGAIALAGGALLSGCANSSASQTETQAIPTVALETVSSGSAYEARRFVGRVEPVSTVDVSFQVGGRLIGLPVVEGTMVEKGALLAALDPQDYALAVREAELAATLARSDYERKQALVSSNSMSRAALEESETQHGLRQVALENARNRLADATLQAPFDALVTRRLAEPFSNIQPGTPVLRIQDVSEYRIKISVPEDLMRMVADPEAVHVEAIVTNGSEHRIPLAYRESNTEPDPVAQTYTATFGLPRLENINLLPGMTVQVIASPDKALAHNALSVPLSAIQTDAGGTAFVWVYETAGSTVSQRSVETGNFSGDRIQVLSGLAAEEAVVIAGGHALSDGLEVHPLTEL